MSSAKSIFSFKYYKYILKKMMPAFIILALIMMAINFITYSTGRFTVSVLSLINISYPNIAFLYIYPVILGVMLFRFLFSKKKSDYFGSMPIKRSELFFTNIVVGATSILLTVLLNTIVVGFTARFFMPAVALAPSVLVSYFGFWVAAYLLCFAMVSLAATVSGTVMGQLTLSAVFAFIPGLITIIAQLPKISSTTSQIYSNNSVMASSLNGFVQTLSAPFYFISQLIMYSMDEMWYGLFANMENPLVILYNFVLAIILIIIGAVLLKKRRFEIAENAYANNKLLILVKACIFVPIAFWFFSITGKATDAITALFFLIFIIIAYIVIDIILKKGLRNFSKSMIMLLCCMLIGLVVNMGIEKLTSIQLKKTIDTTQKVESVSVYVKPIGVVLDQTYGVKNNYIKLDFTDEQLCTLVSNSLKSNVKNDYDSAISRNYWYMTINIGGKTYTNNYALVDSFSDRLFELIESDSAIMQSLDYTKKINIDSTILTSYVEAVQMPVYTPDYTENPEENMGEETIVTGGSITTFIKNKSIITNKIIEANKVYDQMSLKDKYEYDEQFNNMGMYAYGNDFYSYFSSRKYFHSGSYDNSPFSTSYMNGNAKAVYRIDGKYCYVMRHLDEAMQVDIMNILNEEAKDYISKNPDLESCSFTSYINSPKEFPEGISTYLENAFDFLGSELNSVAVNSKPLTIDDNIIRVYQKSKDGRKMTSFYFSYENDIEGLSSSLAQKAKQEFSELKNTNNENFWGYLSSNIEGCLNSSLYMDVESYYKNIDVPNLYGKLATDFEPYYTDLMYSPIDLEKLEGKDILCFSIHGRDDNYYNSSKKNFYFLLDESLYKYLKDNLREYENISQLGFEIIDVFYINGVPIKESDDINYFVKAIGSSLINFSSDKVAEADFKWKYRADFNPKSINEGDDYDTGIYYLDFDYSRYYESYQKDSNGFYTATIHLSPGMSKRLNELKELYKDEIIEEGVRTPNTEGEVE